MIRGALIVLAVLASSPAVAAAKPPPVSAVSQYVEDIPTASGPSVEREEAPAPSGPPVTLPARAEQALAKSGGEQAKRLKAVATAPKYGAPQSRLPKTGQRVAAEAPADATVPSAGDVARAAAGESTALILLLGGTALALGAWALVRARR